MKPASRPQMTEIQVRGRITEYREKLEDYSVFFVGIRGYYQDTMGAPGVNDRSVYDDAMFIFANGVFRAFNGNTDPSKQQPGIAVLQPGFYLYKPGLHGVSGPNPYPAFRQHSNVTVLRDGAKKPVTDDPAHRFWIDIHRGGYSTTSSLGCQTIPPDQWDEYHSLGLNELKKANQVLVPYILIDY